MAQYDESYPAGYEGEDCEVEKTPGYLVYPVMTPEQRAMCEEYPGQQGSVEPWDFCHAPVIGKDRRPHCGLRCPVSFIGERPAVNCSEHGQVGYEDIFCGSCGGEISVEYTTTHGVGALVCSHCDGLCPDDLLE